jgi:hypothetical protein
MAQFIQWRPETFEKKEMAEDEDEGKYAFSISLKEDVGKKV